MSIFDIVNNISSKVFRNRSSFFLSVIYQSFLISVNLSIVSFDTCLNLSGLLFLLGESKCTEIWSENVPDLSYLGSIWSTLNPNLTSLYIICSPDNGTVDFDEFCRLYSKFSHEEQERKEGMLKSIDKLFPCSDGEPVALKKVGHCLWEEQKGWLDLDPQKLSSN